jgi:DNA-binding NarL/FixJ family response regulator
MTEKLIAVEFDGKTGETLVRELTTIEIAGREADYLESKQIKDIELATRESALAKLAALGLTEAEIAAL